MPNWVMNKVDIAGPAEEMDRFQEAIKGPNGDVDFNSMIPMPETLKIVSGSSSDNTLIIAAAEKYGTWEHVPKAIKTAIDEFGFYGFDSHPEKFSDVCVTAQKDMDDLPDGPESPDKSYLFDETSAPKTKPDMIWLGHVVLDNINKYGHADWYDWCCESWGTKWNACEISTQRSDESLHFEFQTPWSLPGPIFKWMINHFPNLTFEGAYADEDFGCNCGTWDKDGVHKIGTEEWSENVWGCSND